MDGSTAFQKTMTLHPTWPCDDCGINEVTVDFAVGFSGEASEREFLYVH